MRLFNKLKDSGFFSDRLIIAVLVIMGILFFLAFMFFSFFVGWLLAVLIIILILFYSVVQWRYEESIKKFIYRGGDWLDRQINKLKRRRK